MALALALAMGPGCDDPQPGESEGQTESEGSSAATSSSSSSSSPGTQGSASSTPGGDETTAAMQSGWFDVGFGETSFSAIEDGGEMHIVWGVQGAAMFPMPIIGGEFGLADDPSDFSDERTPILDLHIDIDGFNDGVGGHFKRIANYPITFEVKDDGTYEFLYVRVIVPDTLGDPRVIDGLPAHLWVQLDPYDQPPMVVEYDLVVKVDPLPV